MNKTSKTIFWCIVFFLLLLGIDQFLLRTEFRSGGMKVAQEFYLDFRQRLFGLGVTSEPASVEAVIGEEKQEKPAQPRESSPRYLYADENGQLQFANSMEEIPPQYRDHAERLEE